MEVHDTFSLTHGVYTRLPRELRDMAYEELSDMTAAFIRLYACDLDEWKNRKPVLSGYGPEYLPDEKCVLVTEGVAVPGRMSTHFIAELTDTLTKRQHHTTPQTMPSAGYTIAMLAVHEGLTREFNNDRYEIKLQVYIRCNDLKTVSRQAGGFDKALEPLLKTITKLGGSVDAKIEPGDGWAWDATRALQNRYWRNWPEWLQRVVGVWQSKKGGAHLIGFRDEMSQCWAEDICDCRCELSHGLLKWKSDWNIARRLR